MIPSSLYRKEASTQSRPKDKGIFREYGEALVIAAILALIIRAFLVQAFSIPSGSMEDTLLVGDYLLVNKFTYGIRNPLTNKVLIPIGTPKRGDVAVFIYPQDPSKDYIKRIIGLPGDRLQIINTKVFINGKEVDTPQAVFKDSNNKPKIPGNQVTRDNYGPVAVPPNSYFVMGDNRDRSYDSRFWGFVPMDALRGKAMIIYFSWAGDHSESLPSAFFGGLKGLLYHFSWDSSEFRVRWRRIAKVIH